MIYLLYIFYVELYSFLFLYVCWASICLVAGGRRGQMLNVFGERTTEGSFQAAVEQTLDQLGDVSLVDYTSVENSHVDDIPGKCFNVAEITGSICAGCSVCMDHGATQYAMSSMVSSPIQWPLGPGPSGFIDAVSLTSYVICDRLCNESNIFGIGRRLFGNGANIKLTLSSAKNGGTILRGA